MFPFLPGNSCNSQDEDEGSESDSSADSCSSPNYDSAVFQSSLRSFQMSESKRKRLREVEVSVCFVVCQLILPSWWNLNALCSVARCTIILKASKCTCTFTVEVKAPLPEINPVSSVILEICWFSSLFKQPKDPASSPCPVQIGDSSVNIILIQSSTVHDCLSLARCNLVF